MAHSEPNRGVLRLQTFFAIASNTKLFTALAVNLLIEDKVTLSNGQPLRLDSRVKDVIPGFTMQNASLADTIRLIDIMSERSYLRGWARADP